MHEGYIIFSLIYVMFLLYFFHQYKIKRSACCVRIGGIRNKDIWSVSNLHELSGKGSESIIIQDVTE